MAESNDKNESLGGKWHGIHHAAVQIPSARSDFASCVADGIFYVFGGFNRVNELEEINDGFWECCLLTGVWKEVEVLSDVKPGARSCCSFAVCNSSQAIYMFGGYRFGGRNGNSARGSRLLNDLWKFDIRSKCWSCIHEDGIHGTVPRARAVYVCTVHNGKFILFGGKVAADTSCNDLHVFDLETGQWTEINVEGTWPSARFAPAWTKESCYLYMHGGGDRDQRPMSDFFALDLETYEWKELVSDGFAPPRSWDHSLCAYDDRLYLCNGCRHCMFVYDIESGHWTKEIYKNEGAPPSQQGFAAHVHRNSLYLFGGQVSIPNAPFIRVLNDLYRYPLYPIHVPTTPIGRDLQSLVIVNKEEFSDVRFMVEGKVVYAYKGILATRSEYFKAMFLGSWREAASGDPIEISKVLHSTFAKMLEFLYSNEVQWGSLEEAKQLLIASDLFQLERLMVLCENWICKRLSNETVISILLFSRHVRQAMGLKQCAIDFLIENWNDPVVKGHLSDLFEDLDLVHEVLQQKYNF